MEDFKGQCFVMQPFDHGRYDNLYEQVFDPAIRDAHLKPYRVDNDPGASIPIETIQQEIAKSLACFGEISEDNPNVWFELGYALAREKPLCLVCSDARTKFPFDIQHRKIITYPKAPLPKDYEELKQEITARLQALATQEEARLESAETASALSVAPQTDGLSPHELSALVLIFEDHFSDGTRPWELTKSMEKGGYRRTASNLAAAGLIQKQLVELKEVETYDGIESRFLVTTTGANWLIENQKKLNLRLPSTSAVDDLIQSTEITDD